MDKTGSNRDSEGRFSRGNPGGPGRPRGFREDLVQAALAPLTPEYVSGIMRRIIRMALDGNLKAACFLIERVCGRPAEAPRDTPPLNFELPKLQTAADCAHAVDLIAAGLTGGTIDLATSKVLLDVVHTRLKAIEVTDLEQRLVELEKASATVDLPGSRRRF